MAILTPMSDTPSDQNHFPPQRAAFVALAIVAFMLVFRPFGIVIDSPATLVVVLGFAPLNFAMMLLTHMAPARSGWIGGVQRIGPIILANIVYIAVLGGERVNAATSVKVIAVGLLVVAAVGLWNRERSARQEVLELRARPASSERDLIVLRGEGDKEIVQLAPQALQYIHANGNYVDVHFIKGGAPDSLLLRATLAGVAAQAPDGFLTKVHRSYFVNLAAAHRLIRNGGKMHVEFEGGARAPVSRAFYQSTRAAALA